MAYVTAQQMIARFGQSELAPVLGVDGTVRVDNATLLAAIADAGAEMDGRLAEAYDLPLPDGDYPLLSRIQADLARARLYKDDPNETVLKRAEGADGLLGQIVDGSRELIRNGAVHPRRPTARFSEPPEAAADRRPNVRQRSADIQRWF